MRAADLPLGILGANGTVGANGTLGAPPKPLARSCFRLLGSRHDE